MNPWLNLLVMLVLIIAVIGFAAFLYTRVTRVVRCPHCGEEERVNKDLTAYPCPKCGCNVFDKNKS